MSDYVIGLSEALWRPIIERSTGRRGWEFIDTPRDYVPNRGDRVLGFFGLTEVQLLQRFEVEVYAFTRDGVALPDAAQALPLRSGLEISLIERLRCAPPAASGFEPGQAALLRATSKRLQRERQQHRAAAQSGTARVVPPALPRPAAPEPPGGASGFDLHASPPAPESAPHAAPSGARPAASAPRGRIAAAHFRRMHGRAATAQSTARESAPPAC